VAWETTTNNGQYHMKDNDEKVNESLELRAIKELHSHLDDNKDGQVDYNESTDFVHDELHHLTSDDRSHTFFSDDRTISYKELWKKWKESKVHNWTCEDVIEWLVGVVELPELVSQFKSIGINGKHLPLIAANIDHFLKKLDAKGHQRRKLQLKAMDVVLFGPLPGWHL
jgi:stromal interaction molecule 1